MRTQIYWSLLLFLLSSLFTLQLSQATLHDSATIANFGSIASPTPPTTGIFFEYGGEEGTVGNTVTGFEQNYADYYAPHVTATYESTPVRTGTRSVKLWTEADVTVSNYRRMHLRKGTVEVAGETWHGGFDGWDTNELYASVWVYIPSDNNIHDPSAGGWVDIFGLQAFWRGDNNPSGGAYSADRWNWRFRLADHDNKRYFEVSYLMEWFNPNYEYDLDPNIYADGLSGRPEYWMTTSNTSICDQWIHLQLYMNISSVSGAGNFKAWIDNNLLADYTPSLVTDPDTWSRWSSENCEYKYPDSGQPSFLIENYHATELPVMWFFWDDAVASTTYVPSSYRVVDKP